MIALAPTAAFEPVEGLVSLSTGDIRIQVHPDQARPGVPRSADQPYRAPSGDAELRELVSRYTAVAGGTQITADHVVVTPGARQAIFATLRAMLGERREVLLPSPYWTSYPALIEMAGGSPVTVPGEVGDGRLTVDRLETLRSPHTAVVVVNSPRNPDGAVTPADSLREIVEWASGHGIGVLFDQVYRGVRLAPEPAPSVAGLYEELPDHCVLIDGLTKSHALAGLRIGWAIAPPPLRGPIVATASHLIGGTCGVAQDTARQALVDGEAQVRTGEMLAGQLDMALSQLAEVRGLRCDRPQGGIFLFPDLREWLSGSAPAEARKNLSGWLRERHGVAVVDGGGFGAPGHVRISFALPREQLREGIRRLRGALGGTRP